MNYNKKSTIRNVILVLSLTILVFIIFFSGNDWASTWNIISKIDLKYFAIAIALVIVYFILYPISLYVLMKHRKVDVSFKDVFIIGSTEHFFNGITPFATGGQPFIAYGLYKKGVKVHESTGILMMNYIIFMIVTNIFAITSLFFYSEFTKYTNNLLWLVITGFGVNFFVLLMLISFGVSRHVRNGLIRLVKWLGKFKLFHKLIESKIGVLENYMDEVQKACKELLQSPKAFFLSFIIKFVMMAIYYLLTFFIIKSIYPSLNYDQMLYVLLGTSFAITMVVWVPTPGGTGGIEFAFSTIFAGIVANDPAIGASGMILWRFVTFYLVLILSFICYLIFNRSVANDDKKKELLKAYMKETEENKLEEVE